ARRLFSLPDQPGRNRAGGPLHRRSAGGARPERRHVAGAGRALEQWRPAPERSPPPPPYPCHPHFPPPHAPPPPGSRPPPPGPARRLARMGLVTRPGPRTSAREVGVPLAARGRALVARLIPAALSLEETLGRGLPQRDRAVVKRALRRMYANMSRHRGRVADDG